MLRFQVYKIQLQLLRLQIATWKLAIKTSKLLKPRTWKWITIGQLLAAAIIFNVYQSFPARKPPAPVVMYDNVASDSVLSSTSSVTTIEEFGRRGDSFPVTSVSKATDLYGLFSPLNSFIDRGSTDIGWSIPSIPRYPRQVVVQLSSSERTTLLESTAKLLLLLQTCSMTLGSLVTTVITVLSYNRAKAEVKLKELELQLKLLETRIKDQEIRLKELQIREAELKVEEMTRARVETARNAQTSRIILVD